MYFVDDLQWKIDYNIISSFLITLRIFYFLK